MMVDILFACHVNVNVQIKSRWLNALFFWRQQYHACNTFRQYCKNFEFIDHLLLQISFRFYFCNQCSSMSISFDNWRSNCKVRSRKKTRMVVYHRYQATIRMALLWMNIDRNMILIKNMSNTTQKEHFSK